jgi:hypothetical protein
MREDLDDLARSAADALVSAMTTDAWGEVKRRLGSLVGHGHEIRMEATHAALATAEGQELESAKLRETRLWSTRFRDLLDDNDAAAAALRQFVADLNVVSADGGVTSQHAHATNRSQAVNVRGSITGNTGEVYVGVGMVDKRRRILLIPVTFFIRVTKRVVGAHPLAAAVTAGAVVAATSAGVVLAQASTTPALASLVGNWQGTFTCAQGLTGISLHVAPEQNGAVAVTEDIYPVPANADVPPGSADARGTLSGTTARLAGVAWRVQPASDWVLANFIGTVPAPGANTFSGTTAGPGCTTFRVQRAAGSPAASTAAGTWTGTYTCAQGLTGLQLTIKAAAGDALRATFAFSPVPSNPSVPSGSYSMTGFIDPAGIFLDASQWIKQPPGYDMVNIVGDLPAGHNTRLAGSIPGCSDITLKRS